MKQSAGSEQPCVCHGHSSYMVPIELAEALIQFKGLNTSEVHILVWKWLCGLNSSQSSRDVGRNEFSCQLTLSLRSSHIYSELKLIKESDLFHQVRIYIYIYIYIYMYVCIFFIFFSYLRKIFNEQMTIMCQSCFSALTKSHNDWCSKEHTCCPLI